MKSIRLAAAWTAAWAAAWAAALLLAGCGSPPPSEPLHFYRLAIEPPSTAEAPPAAQQEGVWQLLTPIPLPDYLQRDLLWLPVGDSGLQPLDGHRWAEPLREALPRLLRQDLARLRGADRVWSGPLPAGLRIDRQLRVELLALEPAADRASVRLSARWSLTDPNGKLAPQQAVAAFSVPSAGTTPQQLVAAHRLALWRLAERIALPAPPQRQGL
ncbi:PqiC family protein [Roseateles violae]|uniref:PqiC family protein n=1 Tax=Roseateles violae TaxID=3058042 RepID=A0ABT8DUR0_9BURK|nr:PqiC family protein [Pelomonas sp. PFR6]MDN3920644.1 PqiC family protein [Pelomonas sp. PFR6]